MGISNKEVAHLDEKAPGLFDRLFTNKPAIYLELLGAVVYDVACKGEGVIVGHGAQIFLKDFNCAFHVMIHASEETRSRWLLKQQNMSEDVARMLIRKMDKRLEDFVQYAFGRGWRDPSGYDLVINLEKFGAEWAARLVIELARSEEVKECSLKALEEMEFSSLKRQIDAALIKNNLASPYVIVEVVGKGQVHLSGWTRTGDERRKIVEAVKDVPGVSQVGSDIDIFVMPKGF